MEGPQRHSIEQLRQEIVRVQLELDKWSSVSSRAKSELEQATTLLRQRQEVKRRLSERLFKLLLDSEDSREERLHHVERSLEQLTHAEPQASSPAPSAPAAAPAA
eukprot:CAMPEP_0183364114 /NCGR_PEP_ID=MMETSP0164_2-20130417/78432_1 /TAXON_ID=221442 /ORGANISM="Coccolithus pelagicus ssp braarudi, Strain PLY182g" /LENGTH=104 /DNA_ID=CAMNT_0025539347 /DNA_START=45 /DNA_END=356 /DNA_ORIENTATION=-